MKIRCLGVMMCRPVQARCLRAVIRLMPSRHTSCSCISWAAARTRKSQRSGFLAGLEVSHEATTFSACLLWDFWVLRHPALCKQVKIYTSDIVLMYMYISCE